MDISLSLSGGLSAPSAKAFLQFVEYLDDKKAPLFVAKSLTYILRTEPPVFVTAEGLLDLVGAWAQDRSAATGERVSDLFLLATRKIVEAYKSNAIQDFSPRAFYRPFTQGLLGRCPEGERENFEEGLRVLRSQLDRRWMHHTEPEFEETEAVEVGGSEARRPAAAGEAVAQIEGAAALSDAEFDRAIADVDHALADRTGLPVRTYVERLVAGGVRLFNAGRIRRAAKAVALADDIVARCNLPQAERDFVWSPASLDRLEPAILARLANDASRQAEIGTLVRCLPDLHLQQALYALEHERSRDRRRFLLKALEFHGAAALPALLERLARERHSPSGSWYLARNLLYVLSRVEIAFQADRLRAIEAVGPYVASELPQVRSAALTALKRIAGRGLAPEAVPHAARALDPAAYPPVDAAGREALLHHLGQAIDLLVASESEEGLLVVAEVATGERGGEFQLGQRLRGLAIDALGRRRAPLPRKPSLAIANHLKQVADRRLKLVVGNLALGVDVAACRALLKLIQGSPEPEVRSLLETPLMRKIAAR